MALDLHKVPQALLEPVAVDVRQLSHWSKLLDVVKVVQEVWGGSTLEGHWKKGLYLAMLAIRVQAVIQRGYRFLTIDASPMIQAITSHHGLRQITTVCDYS